MNFNECFKEAVKDIPLEEVCRVLRISKGTYNRWIAGDSAPHPIGREAVFDAIKKYF